MADLGEFGRAVAQHYGTSDTFRFYGTVFEVPAAISSLVLMEFTAEVKGNQATEESAQLRLQNAEALLDRATAANDADGMGMARAAIDEANVAITTARTNMLMAMHSYIRNCILPEQWPAFRTIAMREACDADELMSVCASIYAAVAGRPTTRPSDSSDGPSSTGVPSMATSASPELTDGRAPQPAALVSEPARVTEMTDARRQLAEFKAHTVPVDQLLTRSSG